MPSVGAGLRHGRLPARRARAAPCRARSSATIRPGRSARRPAALHLAARTETDLRPALPGGERQDRRGPARGGSALRRRPTARAAELARALRRRRRRLRARRGHARAAQEPAAPDRGSRRAAARSCAAPTRSLSSARAGWEEEETGCALQPAPRARAAGRVRARRRPGRALRRLRRVRLPVAVRGLRPAGARGDGGRRAGRHLERVEPARGRRRRGGLRRPGGRVRDRGGAGGAAALDRSERAAGPPGRARAGAASSPGSATARRDPATSSSAPRRR